MNFPRALENSHRIPSVSNASISTKVSGKSSELKSLSLKLWVSGGRETRLVRRREAPLLVTPVDIRRVERDTPHDFYIQEDGIQEYGISEVGKGAVSCSPNFQIPRNLKLDTRTETRARPNSSLENPQISFEDRVENYWRQLIANIRETMQCERTSKRFLSFSIVQKFSCTRKKKNCTDFTTSRFYSRCTRGVIFATVTHFTLVPL